MREKINQLADGIFEYRKSPVETSVENIALKAQVGELCKTTVTITNEIKKKMKGIITSDSPYITVKPSAFHDTEQTVTVSCKVDRMPKEGVVTGSIAIISECGSKSIPVTLQLHQKGWQIGDKLVEDLVQFAKVAEEDFSGATVAFMNPQFQKSFLEEDDEKIALYQGFLKQHNKKYAMEEFLVALDLKKPVSFLVDQVFLQYDAINEYQQETVTLRKSSWGYGECKISADADFIIIPRGIVTTEHFTDEIYDMVFGLDPDKMSAGKNYARIEIVGSRQKVTISVVAIKPSTNHEWEKQVKRHQKLVFHMLDNQIAYAMNSMPKDEYIQKGKDLIQSSGLEQEKLSMRLYRLYLAIVEKQENYVNKTLIELQELAELSYGKAPLEYGAYYFLKGLWSQDEAVIEDCIRHLKECYVQQNRDYRYLWFLLQIDPALSSDRKRIANVMKCIEGGCFSPFMYMEAIKVLNETPEYLSDLSPEYVKVLHWGCKHGYVQAELARRYAHFASRLRIFSREIMEDVTALYEKYPEDDILSAICKILMRGQITDHEAFGWYAKGVERNLKITELYEYYMYAIEDSEDMMLSSSVLLYFLYDNHLTMAKKAMLYAYIVKNKKQDKDSYDSYKEYMQNFALHQLKERRLSRDLVVLYQEFISPDILDRELAKCLADIMFCQEITCDMPEIKGVFVHHRELAGEQFVPFKKGKAYVNIFTDNVQLFFADASECRFSGEITYERHTMIDPDIYLERMLDLQSEDARVLLYAYNKKSKALDAEEVLSGLRVRVKEIDGLDEEFYHRIYGDILEHYYINNQEDNLDGALEVLDWDKVSGGQIDRVFEYCSARLANQKAMEGVMKYGYGGLSTKRLLSISEGAFEDLEHIDEGLVKIAWHLFSEGEYRADIVTYLVKYYSGTVDELVRIYQKGREYDVDCAMLTERLLAQAVFCQEIPESVFDVFGEYAADKHDRKLVQAFLKLMAYEYVMQNRVLPKEIFGYFYHEANKEQDTHCMIAGLKYLSEQEELEETDKNFAKLNVTRLYDKKMVFPFFKKFYGKFTLPIHIIDEHYVEYKADPECEVTIYYRIYGEDGMKPKYIAEKMRDVFEGIRVKEFVLFQDETLEYYITETTSLGKRKGDEQIVCASKEDNANRRSARYRKLSEMMIKMENPEDETIVDQMEAFALEKEMARALFKPL